MNPSLDPYIMQQASCRASLLVSTAGFGSDDWEDLRQEMVLDCLRRSPKFDPSRGDWQGFVRGVIRNHGTVLLTRRYRRLHREVLAEDLLHKEPGTAGDPADPAAAGHKHEIEAGLQMSIDVHRVLNALPSRLRTLALLLSELPVREVCATTGLSRSGVYKQTLQLRDAFARAGFRPHCPMKSAVKQFSPRGEETSQ